MEIMTLSEIAKRKAFLLSILQGESGEDAKETQNELTYLAEREALLKKLNF